MRFVKGTSIYKKRGEYNKAIEEYREALKIKPNDLKTYCNLGLVCEERGLYEEAISSWQRAMELSPTTKEGKEAKRHLYFNEYKKREKEISPQDGKGHFKLGVFCQEKGMSKEAIKEYKKAIEINPKDATAHFNLGNVYYELNEKEKALEEVKKAIALNPDIKASWAFKKRYYLLLEKEAK